MAHKTLINGTQYGIKGGKTLISGTSYSVKNGKTLMGGTEYDISFSLPPAVVNLGEDVINDIIYANGYWVAGGQYYDGNTSNTKIYRIAYASTPDTLGDTE